MNARTVLGLTVLLLVAFTAGFFICLWLASSQSAVVLPLQNRAYSSDESPSSLSHSRLWKHLEQMEAIESDDRSQRKAILEKAYEELIGIAHSKSDSDIDATVAVIIRKLVAAHQESGDNGIASTICFEMRWHNIRLNGFAHECYEVVEQAPAGIISPIAKDLHKSVVLIDPPLSVRRLLIQYKRNPYSSDAMFKLTSSLIQNGYIDPARELVSELFQIDSLKATRLESEIAGKVGVNHGGHSVESEGQK